jgi:toxin-antitoxin system PIN domain toxin
VILVDANLLLYAINRDAPRHDQAKKWFEAVLSGAEVVGLSWNVLLAFLRLTTRPGVFQQPLSIEMALEVVGLWLDRDAVTLVHPGPRHFSVLRQLLLATGSGGNLTTDAHLAALAIENQAVLCSRDSDFSRFPGLTWKDPLA